MKITSPFLLLNTLEIKNEHKIIKEYFAQAINIWGPNWVSSFATLCYDLYSGQPVNPGTSSTDTKLTHSPLKMALIILLITKIILLVPSVMVIYLQVPGSLNPKLYGSSNPENS